MFRDVAVCFFQYHMQKFVTLIVNLMKKENLFASQGGPIILAQAGYFHTSIMKVTRVSKF